LTVIAALERDFDNIQAAWRYAVRARRYLLVDRALDGIFRWMWMVRNRQYEGRAWLRLAREEWAPVEGADPHPVYGRLLARVLDVQASWLRNADAAAQRVEQALAYAKRQDNAAETAFCHWMLGIACMGDPAHNYPGALQHFALSMGHYACTDDRFQKAQLLQDIGHAYHQLWRLGDAAGHFEASLALRRELGDRIGEGYCLSQLGANAYKAGNLAQAAGCWQAAYALRRECSDRQGITHSLFEHSLLALTRGEWRQGGELAHEALTHARSIGSMLHERYALREIEVAAAMAAAEDAGYPALRFAQTVPEPVIALFYLVFGFDEISAQYPRELERALRLAHDQADLLQYMPFAAKLWVKRGELALAAELLAIAPRTPADAQSWVSHLPDVARLRAEVAAVLPPAVYRRACHKGQNTGMATAVRKLLRRLKVENSERGGIE
jgi:tetratricopeptide (TPR) repeat protein